MTTEISYDARLVLRRLTGEIRAALEDGLDVELVLDAVAAGLEGRDFGPSPLALSLTRAFNSSVVPAFGGSDPTEDLNTSAGQGPSDAPPASRDPHAPGPAEARHTCSFSHASTANCPACMAKRLTDGDHAFINDVMEPPLVIRPTDEEILDSFDDPETTIVGVQEPGQLQRSRLEGRPTYDVDDTRDQLRAHFADLQPVDLLLAGAAAVNRHEVDQVALLSLVLFDHVTCLTPIALPDGRVVPSLHAHVSRWKFSPGGFVDTETHASGPLTRGREPLHT